MTTALTRPTDRVRRTGTDGTGGTAAAALVRWEQDRTELPQPSPSTSREDELVMERRAQWYAREAEAIARWQQAPVDGDGPTVVLVHRHEWIRGRIVPSLRAQGWGVLDAQDQAADALGAAVVRQPEVLVTSDRVAGESGLELVERVRRLSPSTTIVVQVDQEDRAPLFTAAGADVVLSHRATWQELVGTVASLTPAG